MLALFKKLSVYATAQLHLAAYEPCRRERPLLLSRLARPASPLGLTCACLAKFKVKAKSALIDLFTQQLGERILQNVILL